MDSMPLPPPPPPPLPGTEGSIRIPTYKESREANNVRASKSPAFDQNNNCTTDFTMDPLREQQYANLPSKLSSCMNKDKKPFTYTIGGAGEKGILDLNQIKSPRMKKRLQANLRGDEDPRNEIRPQSSLASSDPPTTYDQVSFDPEFVNTSPAPASNSSDSLDPMVQDLVHGSSSPPTHTHYQIPLPPPTTIQSLENLSLGLPTSSHPRPSTNSTPAPFNPRYKSPDSGLEDQTSSGLKLDANNNNNSNTGYSYNFNNHNNSPKPFSPGSSAPFANSPFEKQQSHQPQPPVMNKAPTLAQQAHTPVGFSMKSIEEYENSFPRPPPPTVSLIPGREKELPRAKSPVVANPQPHPSTVYAPNVQDQWLAKKQQQQQPYASPYGQQTVQRGPMPVSSGPQFNRSNSYDRKMQDIREAHSDILPPNPQTAYAPTLQEQWMMKKQNPSPAAYQAPVAAAPAPMRPNPSSGSGVAPADHRKFVVLDPPAGSEYRSEPMQSKSFRLLQKLTEGIEDELEEFKALQEMNRLDNEKRQRQQQAQQHQVPQHQTQYSYPGSNVVPNPPQVYAPTLQEQWMAKKQQQQPQQSSQSHQAPVRPAAPASSYQSLASSPSPARHQGQGSAAGHTMTTMNMDSGKEYVIPIRVQERTREQTSRQEQQQQVTRTTVGDFSTIPRLPPLANPAMSCSFPGNMTMDPFSSSPFPATTGFY